MILYDISLSYELLRDPKLIDKLYNQIPKLKTFYKSSKLTCLHKIALQIRNFQELIWSVKF